MTAYNEAKRVFTTNGGNLNVLQAHTLYLYHGWNLVAELDALDRNHPLRTSVWGADLSGSLQGAGGVGGLLLVKHYRTHVTATNGTRTDKSVRYLAHSDANGNVMPLRAIDGPDGTAAPRLAAVVDYDPFGRRILNTLPVGQKACPIGFSSKYEDRETGLLYYGFIYYSPEIGRWLSRDPIGERGGINLLYGMVGNDPVNRVDYLGWKDFLDPWSNTKPNTGATEKDINALIAELKALESVKGKKDEKKCFDVEIHRNAGTNREFLVASRTCDIPFYIAHGSNPKDPTDPNDRTFHPDGTNNTGVSQSGLNQHSSVNGMGQPQCYGCQMKPYSDRDTPINTVMRSLTQAIKALKEQECCPTVRKVCLTVGLDNSGEPSRN